MQNRFLKVFARVSLKSQIRTRFVLMSIFFTYSRNLCSLNTLDLQVQGSRHQGHRIQNDKHTRRPGGRDEGVYFRKIPPTKGCFENKTLRREHQISIQKYCKDKANIYFLTATIMVRPVDPRCGAWKSLLWRWIVSTKEKRKKLCQFPAIFC